MSFRFSIIIPSYQDHREVERCLKGLRGIQDTEIILVEAGGRKIHARGVRTLISSQANRAYQMNLGASKAKGEIFLFLHADTRIPPDSLPQLYHILQRERKYVGGCFRFDLDHPSWKARLMELGVALREAFFRLPYGDQALFVRREIFAEIHGYPQTPLFEDILLIENLKKKGKLLFFSHPAITSARKWEMNGFFKTMWVNWATVLRWRLGHSIEEIVLYREKQFSN